MLFLKNPSTKTWDDIKGIIIVPQGLVNTIWQAVIEIDPAFPRSGRSYDTEGKIITEWSRIPEPFQVLQAIKYATAQLDLKEPVTM